MQPSFLKNKAIILRKRGYSYNLISKKLGVSKSSLSGWLKETPFHPNRLVLDRIKFGPLKSAELRHNIKVADIIKEKGKARKELGIISKRDLFLLGIGLYLGEGSKLYESIRIINSDPQIIKLAIKWFKEICGLNNNNITIAIHLYPDNDVNKCLKYWSKTINIPIRQFRQTQIDRRINKSSNKKRKLPYGTAHLTIISNGNQNFGVKLHRRIMGWIDGVYKQM